MKSRAFRLLVLSIAGLVLLAADVRAEPKPGDWAGLEGELRAAVNKLQGANGDLLTCKLNGLALDLVHIRRKHLDRQSAETVIAKIDRAMIRTQFAYERQTMLLQAVQNALSTFNRDKSKAALVIYEALDSVRDLRLLRLLNTQNNLTYRMGLEQRIYGRKPTDEQKSALGKAKQHVDSYLQRVAKPRAARDLSKLLATAPSKTKSTVVTPVKPPTLTRTPFTAATTSSLRVDRRPTGTCRTCPLRGTRCRGACRRQQRRRDR